MAGIKPVEGLISRALKRAIAYCNMMYDAEQSDQALVTRETPVMIAWVREREEYRRLLEKLQPRRKGAAG